MNISHRVPLLPRVQWGPLTGVGILVVSAVTTLSVVFWTVVSVAPLFTVFG